MPGKPLIAQEHSSYEIMEAKKRGDQIVCGVCGHEICVVSPGDTDGPRGFGPGIYCLTNRQHIEVRFNVALPKDFWQAFKK
jgi:hypothetical protein